MRNRIFIFFTFILYLNFFSQPGKNGVYTVTTNDEVLNKYCPVAADISVGSNSLLLSNGSGFSLCPGDLIMVYQAQGCAIDQTNTINYGNVTSYNSAGLYEFKYVQSINGNTLTVQSTFTNSYAVAGRVQVIKVPQYTTFTINSGASIAAKAWKDTVISAVPYRFGGLVVIHATSIINNGTISASGAGFRGGELVNSLFSYNINSYYTPLTEEGAEKGESIFGYQTDYDAIGGRNGRGAAANGGGGGNSTNCPGGGGANGNNGNSWTGQGVMIVNPSNPIAGWILDPGYTANANSLTNSSGGGRGGYSYANTNLNAFLQAPGDPAWGGDSRREVGGLGGRPLTNINAETCIYFGGGGGAGHENNFNGSAGGNGGGIVYLISTIGISGNGVISSNGITSADNPISPGDGIGGGGAGGSLVIKTGTIVTQSISAVGGDGGNQLIVASLESEGPGGGGGGGFAAISTGAIVPDIDGGLNGTSTSLSITEMISNGATQGATGQIGSVSNSFISFFPITLPISSAPTTTQSSCTNAANAFNLGLTLNPSNLSYTINWAPIPAGVTNFTQSSATGGIAAGIYNATITIMGGCAVSTSFSINPAPITPTFTVNSSYSITCSQPIVTVTVNSPNNYTWTNGSLAPITGSTATISLSGIGIWSVTAQNLSGCTNTQTFSVVANTIVPTNNINPTLQTINCASNSAVTFSGTVSDPTINIQHDWYSPLSPLPVGPPIATSNNTISILSGNIAPGIYTLVTSNLVNGCSTQKTFTITSAFGFPNFSVNSTTNYSLGCAPVNQTTISIINPISTQTPAAICSYTFLPPGYAGTVTPKVILGVNTSTVTQIPGTWTVIVQDDNNFCRTQLPVPIIQNTVAPDVSAYLITQTLTCKNPTLLGIGNSTTANTILQWIKPLAPNSVLTPTIQIGNPLTDPNTSTTSLVYANYVVVAINTLNACQSSSVIVINQNFKPPVSNPTISIATPTAIYCTAKSNPVVLNAGGSTTSGMQNAYASPYLWQGPSPQASISGASSYSCYVAGIYTVTIQDSENGCTKTGTINVLDKTQPPVITHPVASGIIDCGANQTKLLVALTESTIGLKYWYFEYPTGASFIPADAAILNANPLLCGTASSTVNVSKPGLYKYIVTNTITGCKAFGSFNVINGELVADFDPNKMSGYSPLKVDFNNVSMSSVGASGITSIWSYGNGTSQTTTNNVITSTTYNAPGTYTVTLYTSKGFCVDTAYKIINVDLPSKIEVPNVFTPNGDGANDIFYLKTANLIKIDILIYDRWGNKVYDLKSPTGNISWDGKNIYGKECADGVYFYVIKAEGKDGKEYETKGNLTLFR